MNRPLINIVFLLTFNLIFSIFSMPLHSQTEEYSSIQDDKLVGNVYGSVADAHTNERIKGAEVFLLEQQGSTGDTIRTNKGDFILPDLQSAVRRGITNERGEFLINFVPTPFPSKIYTIIIRTSDYNLFIVDQARVLPGAVMALKVDCKLTKGASEAVFFDGNDPYAPLRYRDEEVMASVISKHNNKSPLRDINGMTKTIFATREGLVGGTTANGHVIIPHDHFVALPSRRALNANDQTYDYQVELTYQGKTVRAPVWDVGPWNIYDDHWNPESLREIYSHLHHGGQPGLGDGLPEAQAAYIQGYNQGWSGDFGGSTDMQVVLNPAGIDLADGTFWDDLGMIDNDWLVVNYVWIPGVNVGDRVEVTWNILKVRYTAGGNEIGTVYKGTTIGEVIDGPQVAEYQGRDWIWWKILWDNGIEGWSVENGLEKTTVVDNPPTIDAFSVDEPHSAPLGDPFTIFYTVSDDIGLKQVELWRATDTNGDGQPDWPNDYVDKHLLSGNGSSSGSFSDTPLSIGNYWYGIHVVDNAGTVTHEPDPPGPIKVIVTGSPPPPPTNVQASDGTYTDKIHITWNAFSGATSYEVYRAASSGGSKSKIGITSNTPYDDTSASVGTTYYYWLKAKNTYGTSGYSSSDTGYLKTPCTYSISPASKAFTSSGGSSNVDVTAPSGCSWTAVSNAGWITITSGSSGNGNGSVNYSVSENTSTSARTGIISIEDKTFTVEQDPLPPCTYSISPTSKHFSYSGGNQVVTVDASRQDCNWTATESLSWVSLSKTSGTGDDIVKVTVSSNSGNSRSGKVTIAGKTFSVTQDPISCTYSISPASKAFTSSGGSSNVDVTAPSGCSWTAVSNAGWITITSGSSGNGNGSVNYSVSENTSTSARTGIISIEDKTFTVEQDPLPPCTYSISPTSKHFSYSGGNQVVTVDASRQDCNWTATESLSWVSLSKTSGTGDDIVKVTVSSNSGGSRTGTVTIAGKTFAVTQDESPCTFTISPSSKNFSYSGGSQNVTVNASRQDCTWAATESLPWVDLSTTSGTGNDTVTITASSNSGGSRTGTVTIAGKTFAVTQDPLCTYDISPKSKTFVPSGGSSTVSVTAPSGCSWSAASNKAWISITSGSSDSGNGTVHYSVLANSSTSSRTGTMTIAGKTFTVTQDPLPPCTFTISPPSKNFSHSGGSQDVTVNASRSDCTWSASESLSWVTLSKTSGTGNDTVTITVSSNSGGSRTGTVDIAGKTFAVTQDPLCTADISITKSVDNSTPPINTTVTFTITATNNGPNDATGVKVTDKLPAGLTYISDDSGGSYASATGQWNIGALANGASATLHITARVDKTGGITNTATKTASNPEDTNVGNDTAGTSISVPELAALSLDMDPSTRNYDDTISSKDIEQTIFVPENNEAWIAVVAQGVTDLDTYQVEVSFDTERVAFIEGVEDNPFEGIENLLKKNGGDTVGFQAVETIAGTVNIANALTYTDCDQAPEGTGILALLKFRVLDTDPDNYLTLGNVFFIDCNGSQQEVTNLTNGSFNTCPPWDFTCDGIVNYLDLAIFADHWLLTDRDAQWDAMCNLSPVADAGDQIINYLDLAIFADHWLEETP
jgi:uncharacterized repeat protein (TIGR01451 family)